MNELMVLQAIKGIMIDIDGTLMSGNTPLPSMSTFLEFLSEKSLPYVILSNNSTRSPEYYYNIFHSYGDNLALNNILTCSTITAQYIRHKYSGNRVFVIGEIGLVEALQAEGFQILEDNSAPVDFVVVGGDHFLTYEKLKYACLHLQRGAILIGTNPDVISPSEEGLIPEAGTNIAAMEAASGQKAIIIGKPNRIMFTAALEKLGTPANATVIIGDRLETDILGGIKSGLKTILVESGVDNRFTCQQKNIFPHLIVTGLTELLEKWNALY